VSDFHGGCQSLQVVLFRAPDNGRGPDNSLFQPGYSSSGKFKRPWKVTQLTKLVGKGIRQRAIAMGLHVLHVQVRKEGK